MIPASARYGVPGADDETIFADILKSLGRDRDDIGRALARLAALAGGSFADLPAERRLRRSPTASAPKAARRWPRSRG